MDAHDQESRITADRWETFEMHQSKQLKNIHSKQSPPHRLKEWLSWDKRLNLITSVLSNMSNHNLKYEMILKCFALIKQIFDRCVSWEDPTKWVVLRYPWNKDHSRVFHTLRKLRQVDVVLNRNQLGSDNGEANVFNVFEAHSFLFVRRCRFCLLFALWDFDEGQSDFNSSDWFFLGNIATGRLK